jgi:formylglycine-generating enzyme required for sulfatase activity
VEVSWEDARDYAAWLSRKTDQSFRLPTEAEWEYAARAGTDTARFWGELPDAACRYANVHDRTSKKGNGFSWTHHNCDDGYAVTAPIGSFRANAFGLHDMLGNVWEWCADWYGKDYYGYSPKDNPTGPSSESLRVIRGGGWSDNSERVRSAFRSWFTPNNRGGYLGFRLVLSSYKPGS